MMMVECNPLKGSQGHLPMAELSKEILNTIVELQQKLALLIHQACATEFSIFGIYGETADTMTVLEQLTNIRQRATSAYERLLNLLLRISELQPLASTAILDLLAQTIEQAQATVDAGQATVQEARHDWNLS